MNREQNAAAARRIANARAMVIKKNPFFGHLAMSLTIACAPCGTACTDGTHMIFDPAFVQKLTDREIEFVILHETLHCVLGHISRDKNMLHRLYNIACDTVVNSIILEMWNLGDFQLAGQTPVHLAPDGKEGRLYTAEEVYAMLLDDIESAESLPVTALLDSHDYWQSIPDQTQQIRDQWSRRITQASSTFSEISYLPSAVRDVIAQAAEPSQTNWRQVLQEFMYHDIYDYSFFPPDRRFTESDFLLPAYNITDDGRVREVWVCIDTSCSMSDQELSSCLGYVLDIIHMTNMAGRVSFFDSRVSEPVPFDDEDEFMNAKPTGGGGTSFREIFRYLEKNLYPEWIPDAILIFTDGYASCPEEEAALGIPVLWLITKGGRTDFSFGTVAELD